MADSEAPFSPSAWDGPSRRAAHGLSGLAVRSERYICGCVRCDAESRRTAAARSGIFGWTIRDSSCYHWMAVGIRRMRGRLSAAKPCACSAAECVRLRRRGCDAFVLFAHPAWACRVSPVAIRWLGSDLRSGQGARTPTVVRGLRRGARGGELRRDSCKRISFVHEVTNPSKSSKYSTLRGVVFLFLRALGAYAE